MRPAHLLWSLVSVIAIPLSVQLFAGTFPLRLAIHVEMSPSLEFARTRHVLYASKNSPKKKPSGALKGANEVASSTKGKSGGNQATQALPPPRVTNQINIPVRQQIAWAKAYKRLTQASSGAGTTHQTKKFRKERTPKQEEEEYVEIDYVNTPPPAVFVDGYNIIGYINSMEGRNLDLESARDCLINDLCVLKAATGWWIEVIFDAYKRGGATHRMSTDNVLITFTSASETADMHIERRFEELRAQGFRNMVVATDDNVLRMIAGSSGSGFLSAEMLVEEMRIAYRGWEILEDELAQESKRNKPTLESMMSPDLREAIESLRKPKSREEMVAAAKAASEAAAAKKMSQPKPPTVGKGDVFLPPPRPKRKNQIDDFDFL